MIGYHFEAFLCKKMKLAIFKFMKDLLQALYFINNDIFFKFGNKSVLYCGHYLIFKFFKV